MVQDILLPLVEDIVPLSPQQSHSSLPPGPPIHGAAANLPEPIPGPSSRSSTTSTPNMNNEPYDEVSDGEFEIVPTYRKEKE